LPIDLESSPLVKKEYVQKLGGGRCSVDLKIIVPLAKANWQLWPRKKAYPGKRRGRDSVFLV